VRLLGVCVLWFVGSYAWCAFVDAVGESAEDMWNRRRAKRAAQAQPEEKGKR
jgi:hypothetical protein